LGMPFIGSLQDNASSELLQEKNKAIYSEVVVEKDGILGEYNAIDLDKVNELSEDDQNTISIVTEEARHGALAYMAIFPLIMLLSYIGLNFYFKGRGGYEQQVLTSKE